MRSAAGGLLFDRVLVGEHEMWFEGASSELNFQPLERVPTFGHYYHCR